MFTTNRLTAIWQSSIGYGPIHQKWWTLIFSLWWEKVTAFSLSKDECQFPLYTNSKSKKGGNLYSKIQLIDFHCFFSKTNLVKAHQEKNNFQWHLIIGNKWLKTTFIEHYRWRLCGLVSHYKPYILSIITTWTLLFSLLRSYRSCTLYFQMNKVLGAGCISGLIFTIATFWPCVRQLAFAWE